jgi:D-hydroxyproline dehydrogenase subunit alpha
MRVRIDGRKFEAKEGTTVASAMLEAGVHGFRQSVVGEPRQPLCGMGVCFECRAAVNGVPHERTCMIPCRDGMEIETGSRTFSPVTQQAGATSESCDVLVVGGGPAGLAAAVAAARCGKIVTLADEQFSVGGQIWRGMADSAGTFAERYLAEMFRKNVRILSSATVFDLPDEQTAALLTPTGRLDVRFQSLILATGARELYLPFPGWTLPGVFGAGGLQALVKGGLPIQGKRVLVAGSGPLLMAVAKTLAGKGARIVRILEQAPPGRLRELTLSLWKRPDKLGQSLGFLGVARKLLPGWWVQEAKGRERLDEVVATDGKQTKTFACDYLACGYGLVPNLELAQLAGCRIVEGFVKVEEFQRTSSGQVFAVGELTAIGGVDAAAVQGAIAGFAAGGAPGLARKLARERQKAHDWAMALAQAYPLREEVLRLAQDNTPVCRCEDVRFGGLQGRGGFRDAKLHTRLGMGACQGRICGAACRAMFGWEEPAVRTPITPVPLRALCATEESPSE